MRQLQHLNRNSPITSASTCEPAEVSMRIKIRAADTERAATGPACAGWQEGSPSRAGSPNVGPSQHRQRESRAGNHLTAVTQSARQRTSKHAMDTERAATGPARAGCLPSREGSSMGAKAPPAARSSEERTGEPGNAIYQFVARKANFT